MSVLCSWSPSFVYVIQHLGLQANTSSICLWLRSELWLCGIILIRLNTHQRTAFLLHSSLANFTKQNIYLVLVLFCPHASGQCLAGKIDFHPHHSCFAEWIMMSSRIFIYLQNSQNLLQKNINMFDVRQTFCVFSGPLKTFPWTHGYLLFFVSSPQTLITLINQFDGGQLEYNH